MATEKLISFELCDEQGGFLGEVEFTEKQVEHLTALGNGDPVSGIHKALEITKHANDNLPPEDFAAILERGMLEIDMEDAQRATKQ